MRFLVTGANGFVGSYLVARLRASTEHDVIGVDYGDGDLSVHGVARSVIADTQPGIVVHLAAKVGRLFGEEDPGLTISANATATTHVAQACAAVGARFVYASTSEAFGDNGTRSVPESEHGSLPHNLYGLSKRWGEEAAMLYAPVGLQMLRFSMPFGPGLPAGRGRAAVLTFLWLAHHRKTITVHRGGKRCLLWVDDLIDGIMAVIDDSGGGVWTIGRDDNEMLMRDVAELACDIAGAPASLINEVDPPPNQTVIKRLENQRLKGIGWAPRVDVREGMELTYEAVKQYDAAGLPPLNWSAMIEGTDAE